MGKFKQFLGEQDVRVIGTTSTDEDHYHEYQISPPPDGNGKTMSTIDKAAKSINHEHVIKNYVVKPAGKKNHIHTIKQDKVTE